MANPIKHTPFLYGSASKRFNRILTSEKNEKASIEEKERIADVVRRVLAKKNEK